RGDQPVDAVGSQDCGELGAAGRYFADRAVEVDVGDQPAVAVAVHHVVDLDRLAIGLDDLAPDHGAGRVGLFAGDLQFLPGIAVETVGIDRRDVPPEAVGELLAPGIAQTGPGRADRQAGHRRDVEGSADDRLELGEPAALPERAAVLHRAEQRLVKALHGIPAARRRRMHRVGEHRETDPGGERRPLPYACPAWHWLVH